MSGAGSFPYALLSLAAGIGIPIMAALNSTLGARLGHPVAAAAGIFIVGGIACGTALIFAAPLPDRIFQAAPPVYYLGGLLVAFYVLSITWVAPRFGVGNAVFFVLLGQLLSASLIDHFGLLGAGVTKLDLSRITGLVLMIGGVFLARRSA